MSLAAGTRLDNYEIIRPLAAGGMGEVYLAHDRQLNRSVAVKMLRPELTAEPHRLARFEQEARAASALSHPNICHIYQLGETSDRQRYIAMEYVEGETLAQWLDVTRPTLREALDVAIQIASAISAAHTAGVIHRDIKPENVMLRRDRLVKVLDFGLAKILPSDTVVARHESTRTMATHPGSLVGTTQYMAPEQARGQEVDARTDVWALGVVLYEMLTGNAPFTGASASDVLVAILDREPVALTSVDPHVSPELARIVSKALKKDPEQRYQTVKDLLLDLEALRDELSGLTAAHSVSNPDRTNAPARLTRATLAIIAILATGGVVWWVRSTGGGSGSPDDARPRTGNYPYTRLTFGTGLQTDPAFSPDGKFIAYASDRSGNFDIWVQPLKGHSEPVQVTKSPAHDTQPSWSPDGTTLVFRSDRGGGGLFLVPAFGGAERQLTSFGSHPRWSDDGSEILLFSGRVAFFRRPAGPLRIHSVTLDGAPPREILGDFLQDGSWMWAAPHPDGRMSLIGRHRARGPGFFTVSRDGRQVVTPKLVALAPTVKDEPFRFQGATPHRFHWNATGDTLYVEAASNETRSLWRVTVNPATLDAISAERLTTPGGRDVAPALSRDGTRLVFSQQNEASRIVAFPLDMGGSRARIVGEGRPLTDEDAVASMPSLSLDGSRLAYELSRPGIDRSELWVMNIDGGTRELLATNARAPVWSRDGTRVTYTYFRGGPQRLESAVAYRQLGGTERFLTPWSSKFFFIPSDWAPDGASVLGLFLPSGTGTSPTSVALWPTSHPKAERPDRVLLSSPAAAQLWCSTLSPDARWILSTLQRYTSADPSLELVVARPGTPPEQWVRIASDHQWPDKPRWGSDGKTIFFISKGSTPHFNLWAAQFDPDRGHPIGKPFALTQFDSSKMAISPYIDDSYLGISSRHAVLQMMSVSGSIWMLEGIDR